MTVSSELNRKQYAGNGVTTSFATSPVVFFDSSDLDVYVVTTATGAATLLTETTDYTVSGGDGSTGTVATTGLYGAPSASQTLVIVRNVPLTQESDFVQNDASDAEVVEDALDKLTMALQQVDARVDRSFVLADSDVSGVSTTLPTPVASRLLGWNSGGTALENFAASDLSAVLTTTFTESLLDDGSAGVFVETLRGGLTEDTAPAIDDEIITRDTTNTTGKRMTLANVFKVINGMTVDSSPDSAADYVTTYDASASAAKKVLLGAIGKVPSGVGSNIAARTNAGAPTTTVDITADELVVRDTNGHAMLLSAVSVSPAITASGANGLDTGAEAGDTWYYGWVIAKADGTVAGLLSASATTPTLPSGYTFKARITAVRNNGSSNFIAFRQFGREIFYEASQQVLGSGSSTTEAAVSCTAVVPPIAQAFQIQNANLQATNSGNVVTVSATIRVVSGSNYLRNWPYFSLTGGVTGDLGMSGHTAWLPNISQQFYYLITVTTGSAPAFTVDVLGFRLPGGGS